MFLYRANALFYTFLRAVIAFGITAVRAGKIEIQPRADDGIFRIHVREERSAVAQIVRKLFDELRFEIQAGNVVRRVFVNAAIIHKAITRYVRNSCCVSAVTVHRLLPQYITQVKLVMAERIKKTVAGKRSAEAEIMRTHVKVERKAERNLRVRIGGMITNTSTKRHVIVPYTKPLAVNHHFFFAFVKRIGRDQGLTLSYCRQGRQQEEEKI